MQIRNVSGNEDPDNSISHDGPQVVSPENSIDHTLTASMQALILDSLPSESANYMRRALKTPKLIDELVNRQEHFLKKCISRWVDVRGQYVKLQRQYTTILEQGLIRRVLTPVFTAFRETSTPLSHQEVKYGVYTRMRQLMEDNVPPPLFTQSNTQLDSNDDHYLTRYMDHVDRTDLVIHRYKLNTHDFETLRPGRWLNDAIINAFCCASAAKTHGRCVFMNSFFYEKLRGKSKNLLLARRYLMKANAMESQKIIFPINVDKVHWVVGVFNLQTKCIEYYDSMSISTDASNSTVSALCDSTVTLFNASSPWSLKNCMSIVPQQNNTNDCGVFACRIFHTLCDEFNYGFPFSQRDMHSTRCQIAFNLFFVAGIHPD
ncbi:sentrin/SUMO-specific protease [Perkinsela sp. CCAP 1560/4]|nr:sentrin/SUMO-specific protease [Perkinsela sp. CCAP 1560/4]|eukprot:KNH03641.1 sentrin/SUMO-specific protease [Perkinsela sp. CCAP 1560/4]